MRDDAIRPLLDTLDLARKVRLLTGDTFWSLPAEPAIGLRRLVLSDGPAGVRGETFDERDPSLSLPSATALAATWDTALARRYGAALGAEARRKGVDLVLGPTINLHRTPFGGRHFEAFSEDPLLTGGIAVAYVEGMQACGVAAVPKHYVANDAETDRFTADSRLDDRTLRECALAPFERAVGQARAWAVMSSYNAVNGTTMSESPLLRSPLKDEWGFDGVVVSDWTAVRSTEASASAAQDLVMPGPAAHWGDALVEAVRAGRVPESAVDEKVERLLRLAARVGALDGGDRSGRGTAPVAEDGPALAREVAAAGTVLVRNIPVDGVAALPWAAPASVAVIGHNAVLARTQGGGSAAVLPREVVPPLDGLRAALGDRVRYRTGALVAEGVQALAPSSLTNPETGGPGVRVRYLDADGGELAVEDRLWVALVWLGSGLPAGTVTVELRTCWAAEPGRYRLGARALGELLLMVDGETVLDTVTGSGADRFVAAFADPPTATADVTVDGTVELVLRHTLESPIRAVTLGVEPVLDDPDAEIAAAVALAGGCEVALVVVGTNEQVESEGFDRSSLALPGRQDDLVRAVAAANPRTVVLVNAGAPVLMPWRDDVAAVLLGWFGGERFGEAVADVLLGRREPGGRLPTTWPATGDERAVLSGTPVDGAVVYAEGVHVGHRGWLRTGETPAYPFGHGLGYTTWKLRAASASVAADGTATVEVELANTGARAGRQVVQAYLSRSDSAVDRPARWLAGWAVVDAGPGPSTVGVTVDRRAFGHWAGSGWEVEPGEFTVHVGTSVLDTPLSAPVVQP